MRIIHRGTSPANRPRWHYDVDLTCDACGTVFRLEPGDRHTLVNDWRAVEHQSVAATCPVCGARVTGEPPAPAEAVVAARPARDLGGRAASSTDRRRSNGAEDLAWRDS